MNFLDAVIMHKTANILWFEKQFTNKNFIDEKISFRKKSLVLLRLLSTEFSAAELDGGDDDVDDEDDDAEVEEQNIQHEVLEPGQPENFACFWSSLKSSCHAKQTQIHA